MTEYQTPRLPRLLDRERVEVRLGINGTHVFEETGIDRLLSHLTEAKRLFRPDYDPATGASYESLVKELHLTRLALEDERERCAKVARAQAKSIRRCNTHRGRVNNDAEQAAIWCEQIAAEIEKSNATL